MLKQSKKYCSLPDLVNSFTFKELIPPSQSGKCSKNWHGGRFFFRHCIFFPTMPLAPLSQPCNQQRWPAGHVLQHLPSDHTGYFSLPIRITLKPPSLMPQTPFLWHSSAMIQRAFLDSNNSDIGERHPFSTLSDYNICGRALWSICRVGNTVTSFKITNV